MAEHEMHIDKGIHERVVKVDYPSNSKLGNIRALPDPEKETRKVEPIVTGEVVRQKKGIIGRLGESFGAEAGQTFLEYIVTEVIVSTAKNTASDIVRSIFGNGVIGQGFDRAIFGETTSPGRGRGFNYSRVSRDTTTVSGYTPRQFTPADRARHEFENVVIADRNQANDVLGRLRELIEEYDQATVADFYDLAGISRSFVDERWGWRDLRAATVRGVRGGYIVALPRTVPLS